MTMLIVMMMVNGGAAMGLVAYSSLKVADAEQNLSLIRDLDAVL